ncbi:MAG: hypothetical protein JWQ28_2125 [Pedobacter sp.]|jgi:hypothetical protein|nr:hypothetical protein [Pedobacter sp.]
MVFKILVCTFYSLKSVNTQGCYTNVVKPDSLIVAHEKANGYSDGCFDYMSEQLQ